MKLSVIIPMYNAEPYLEGCVSSCLDQKGCDLEILMVDDGSEDGTLEKARALESSHREIRVFSKSHNGQGAARNMALDHASGDYVWFVDADDTIAAGGANKILELAATENSDIIAICGANLTQDGPMRRFSWKGMSLCSGADVIRKNKLRDNTPFSIYKRSFLENNKLRFLEGVYHEDAEFTPRAYYFAHRVSFVDDILYYVYLSPGSTTRSSNPKRAFDSIDIIQPSLSKFAMDVDVLCRRGFDDIISSNLNHALKNSYGFDKSVNKRLNETVFKHKNLFVHLKRSSFLKFRMEYYVFSLFPRHTVEAYKFMQRFNTTPPANPAPEPSCPHLH